MATSVPSRFAVLAIDDDDSKPIKINKPSTTHSINNSNNNISNYNNNSINSKLVKITNSNGSKIDKIKQSSSQSKKEDKKKSNKNNKKKKNGGESQQWEQWKEKDTVAIEEAYKAELHEAIMLSKLSYESQIEIGVNNKDCNSKDAAKKNTGNSGSSKKSKTSTMSLEEFNNLGCINTNITSEHSNGRSVQDTRSKDNEADTEFFVRVDKETKEELIKTQERDRLKSRLNQLDDDITSAQLKVEVEKRDNEIIQLKKEVKMLRSELLRVKERNKKLCEILADGEMKDKASVLAEVSKLQEIRDELTCEVTSLHAQLEQERSKTRASSADIKMSKNKKRPVSENA